MKNDNYKEAVKNLINGKLKLKDIDLLLANLVTNDERQECLNECILEFIKYHESISLETTLSSFSSRIEENRIHLAIGQLQRQNLIKIKGSVILIVKSLNQRKTELIDKINGLTENEFERFEETFDSVTKCDIPF